MKLLALFWNRKMIDDAQFDLPEDCIVKDEDGITVNFDASRKFAKKLIKVVVSVTLLLLQTGSQTLQVLWLLVLILTVTHTFLRMATDRYMPEQWAAKAISLYNEYEADLIVAERNQVLIW